jgi:hypothetical protein
MVTDLTFVFDIALDSHRVDDSTGGDLVNAGDVSCVKFGIRFELKFNLIYTLSRRIS